MLLTLSIQEVLPATARARVVRIDLGGHRFPYRPGQAVLVAAQGREPRKPYSLTGAPEDASRDGFLELLVGVDESGSAGAHLPLQTGQALDIEGPAGRFTFPDQPEERRFLFIAGGTGIAPLRSMLRHALNIARAHIGLLYSARTPDEFAYEEELRELAARGRVQLKLTVTRDATDTWTGTRGRISRSDLAPLVHDPATLCFICGPPALMDDMPKLLAELGVAPERIRREEWA